MKEFEHLMSAAYRYSPLIYPQFTRKNTIRTREHQETVVAALRAYVQIQKTTLRDSEKIHASRAFRDPALLE